MTRNLLCSSRQFRSTAPQIAPDGNEFFGLTRGISSAFQILGHESHEYCENDAADGYHDPNERALGARFQIRYLGSFNDLERLRNVKCLDLGGLVLLFQGCEHTLAHFEIAFQREVLDR